MVFRSSIFKSLSKSPTKKPIAVLELEGHDYLYTTSSSGFGSRKIRPWIMVEGTTKDINQQLQPESGGASSITRAKIQIIDKSEQLTKDFSLKEEDGELLGRRATFWIGFEGGSFPRDYMRVIEGLIDQTSFGAGYLTIALSHPDKLRKSQFYTKPISELSANLSIGSSSLGIVDSSGFLSPQDDLRTFVRIGDEIMEYQSKTGSTLGSLTRGALGTVEEEHEAGDEIEPILELSGSAIDLVLKIYLSKGGETKSYDVTSIKEGEKVTNSQAIFFDHPDIQDYTGLVEGDFITLSGTSLNDFSDRKIVSFGKDGSGSFIAVDGVPLVSESGLGEIKGRSQYDVLPFGCGMLPSQVDVREHLRASILFSSQFPGFRFYIKDDLRADDFINTQILQPCAAYYIPRGGRVSVKAISRPIGSTQTTVLDESNVKSPEKIKVNRGINRHFYNSIIYKYNEEAKSDKLLNALITQSEESFNRIDTSVRPLKIEAGGLRSDNETEAIIENNSNRWIDRYKFSAEEISVEVLFSEAVNIELGDTVIFGSKCLKISDSKNGSREFVPRIMEVINKQVNWSAGKGRLVLLDTNFNTRGRYGAIAPSSRVTGGDEGCLETEPFCSSVPVSELVTWQPFLGTKILVRNEDWTFQEEVKLVGIGASGALKISPALSSFPPNLIVDPANYPDSADPNEQKTWKDFYVFFNPRFKITSVVDLKNFEVSATDAARTRVGSIVTVHSPDFTNQSQEVEVSAISSNKITVSRDLDYLPSAGDEVDLIGFPDGGLPYRLV